MEQATKIEVKLVWIFGVAFGCLYPIETTTFYRLLVSLGGICPSVSTVVVCFHDCGVRMAHVCVVTLVHYDEVKISDLHLSASQLVHQQLKPTAD